MLKISVVIPTFNAADTLERAVESCLQQNFTGYEIIIVDNNSTDETLRVARALADAHDVISVLQERKQGAAAARNTGARAARGEWLQFLDADDVLLGGKWERQMELVNKNTKWIIGGYETVLSNGRRHFTPGGPDPIRGLLYSGEVGCMNSNQFKRETYLELGGMKEDLPDHEDYDLYFRMIEHNHVYVFDSQASCLYLRPAHNTLSTIDDVGRVRRRVELTEKILSYTRDHLADYYEANLDELNSYLFRHIVRQGTFDPSSAKINFNKHFPEGLRSVSMNKKLLSKTYYLYKWLNFSTVERVRCAMRKVKNFDI